mmetsp:Transcript_44444/g.117978  ORF Transcript_44444/g.117978 Transcript_44444/m.117978 type:complete len:203 (+) Transcript_44444:1905-2513(+)
MSKPVKEHVRTATVRIVLLRFKHQPQTVGGHVIHPLLKPIQSGQQLPLVGVLHGILAVMDRPHHGARLGLNHHVGLEEPLLVKQAGESAEHPNVLGRDACLWVDPLPVVEHATGIVDRRLPTQLRRNSQPAPAHEGWYSIRPILLGMVVHVSLPDVAVQLQQPLQHDRPLLTRQCSLQLPEEPHRSLHQSAKPVLRQRSGDL